LYCDYFIWVYLVLNWTGRDEEEDPGKDREKKWKEIFKCWE